MDATEWVDGNVTSGTQSAVTKKNEQLPEGSAAARQNGNTLLDHLSRNPLFISAALPLKICPPLFNSCAGGQRFDTHINAIRPLRGGT